MRRYGQAELLNINNNLHDAKKYGFHMLDNLPSSRFCESCGSKPLSFFQLLKYCRACDCAVAVEYL
jgi:hypothetical protein